ncbi:MAG: hypothetical protein JSR46_06635, partial [Verrucomicrobia bacterium]|nr:hypothetical protein [Verrucomicrobiota bacterium]
MSILINMEPDGIPAYFPKERAGRAAYAASVATTMGNLPGMSLRDIKQLRDKIVSDVGINRLSKAEEASRTPTLHYYLWSREHPTLDFIFRIITIGIVHFIAEHGHALYDRKAPIFDLVQSVAKIGDAESRKQVEV